MTSGFSINKIIAIIFRRKPGFIITVRRPIAEHKGPAVRGPCRSAESARRDVPFTSFISLFSSLRIGVRASAGMVLPAPSQRGSGTREQRRKCFAVAAAPPSTPPPFGFPELSIAADALDELTASVRDLFKVFPLSKFRAFPMDSPMQRATSQIAAGSSTSLPAVLLRNKA